MPLPNYGPIGTGTPVTGKQREIRPNCPKCGNVLDDVFKGGITFVTSEWWACARCKFETPKYAPKMAEAPKVVIAGQNAPATAKPEAPKIEPDETVRADKLSFWDKLDLPKSRRPQPRKYFCQTCNVERTTLGRKCPVCKNDLV